MTHEETDSTFARTSDDAQDHSSELAFQGDLPQVPDSPAGLGPDPTWQPEQYRPSILASGADKLADSAVAPLVAVARGYRTVTEDSVKGATADYGLGDGATRQARQVKRIVGSSDAMFMQWYRTDDVVTAARARERARARGSAAPVNPRSSSLQLRPNPATARINERGKPVKYELVTGSVSSIGVHPAMPESWILEPARVFITEGTIKGDAALTGLLRHHGISEDKLASADPDTARDLLTGVLESFDPDDRVLVLSLVGVGNWHHNPDWNMIDVRGKDVLVAFDGDINENVDVWRQAEKLRDFLGTGRDGHGGKGGRVLLVDIPSEEHGRNKPGVDDYLSTTGKWADLADAATETLPPRPVNAHAAQPGDLRVDDETCTVQKLSEVTDTYGTPQGVAWQAEYDLAGRVLEYGSTRFPTSAEERTGVLGAGTEANVDNIIERTSAAVEVTWRDPETGHDSEPATAVVTGTSDMLADEPNQWHRRGHVVPARLSSHPSWPPKPDWLKAVKSHRRDETIPSVAWERMGWVPASDGGSPVFIAGGSVIGPAGDATGTATPGVTDKVVSRASSFGLEVPEDDEATKAAIRTVLKTYTAGAWTDRRVAAAVLAAALRPVVPLPPRLSIFLSGPPRKGKALPLDALVPVPVSDRFPTGWAANRELGCGDHVYAPDGTLSSIASTSPIVDDVDMYDMTLSDGRRLRSTASHLWRVSTKQSRSAYQRSRRAKGRQQRRAKVAHLRRLAQENSNADGMSLRDLAALADVSYSSVHGAVRAAGLPAYRVQVHGVDGPSTSLDLYPVGEALTVLADKAESRSIMPRTRVVTSAELAAIPREHQPAIDLPAPFDGPNVDLPVDPYVLGAWLGDGTGRSGEITTADPEVVEFLRDAGYDVTNKTPSSRYGYNVCGLLPVLRGMGVLRNKHVPAMYLRASYPQRLALLQGLMDTDGTIISQGQCEFTQCDERMALEVLELVHSLGLKATIGESDATLDGRVVGRRWRVRFTTSEQVFRLPRKADMLPRKVRGEGLVFVDRMERLEPKPSRCIQVHHHSGMFLADGFVPTHNSWTASAVMAFWQAEPGTFFESLPGAATDTRPATENALARTPVWVIDDLPPSADRRQSEADQAKVGSLIRAVFNGAPRQKMFADGTTRPAPDPLSLLLVTSENLLSVSSEMDRVVHIPVANGFLSPSRVETDAIASMATSTTLPMQVTGACARFVASQGASMGWRDTLTWWRERMEDANRIAVHAIDRSDPAATRHAQTAASLSLGLIPLLELALDLDMPEEVKVLDTLFEDLNSLVADCFTEQKSAAPGSRIIEAVRSVLAGGKAHLVAPGVGGPPVPGSDEQLGQDAKSINAKLGWPAVTDEAETPRPTGLPIGSLVHKDDTWYALLSYRTAFSVAQSAYPELVSYGQSATASWNSAWDEGFAGGPWVRKSRDGNRKRPYVRAHGDSDVVPVPLDALLDLPGQE